MLAIWAMLAIHEPCWPESLQTHHMWHLKVTSEVRNKSIQNAPTTGNGKSCVATSKGNAGSSSLLTVQTTSFSTPLLPHFTVPARIQCPIVFVWHLKLWKHQRPLWGTCGTTRSLSKALFVFFVFSFPQVLLNKHRAKGMDNVQTAQCATVKETASTPVIFWGGSGLCRVPCSSGLFGLYKEMILDLRWFTLRWCQTIHTVASGCSVLMSSKASNVWTNVLLQHQASGEHHSSQPLRRPPGAIH